MSFYLGQKSKISLIKIKGFFNKEESLPYVEGGTAVLHGLIYQAASQAMLESAANKYPSLASPGRRLFSLFFFFFHRADTIAIHLKIIVAQIYRGTHRLSNLVTFLSTKVHMCKQLKKKTFQSWWECPATPSKKQHKLHPIPTSTVRLRLTHFNPSPQHFSSASTNSPGSSQCFLLYFTYKLSN